MKHILIDCDPGHDDALAILTAIANNEMLNILGITTIGGNQTLEKVTQNAKNILAFVDAKIPLSTGQAGPLVKQLETGGSAHGNSGMDGPLFKSKDYPITSNNAVKFMYDVIMEQSEKVTLVGLGPLTNIALLLKIYPEIHEKITCISIMGGGLDRGNMTALAEFNIYVDPEAAAIVFHSGIPIIMAGLDVTEKATITYDEIQELANGGSVSNLAYQLLSFYYESGKQFGFVDSPLHDLCAVAYLIEPEIFEGKFYTVDIIQENGPARGMTYADKRLSNKSEKNVFVLENLNKDKFIQLLKTSLKKLDEI